MNNYNLFKVAILISAATSACFYFLSVIIRKSYKGYGLAWSRHINTTLAL